MQFNNATIFNRKLGTCGVHYKFFFFLIYSFTFFISVSIIILAVSTYFSLHTLQHLPPCFVFKGHGLFPYSFSQFFLQKQHFKLFTTLICKNIISSKNNKKQFNQGLQGIILQMVYKIHLESHQLMYYLKLLLHLYHINLIVYNS